MPDSCLTMRHPAKESARLASLGLEATLAAMRDDIINRHSRNATCSLRSPTPSGKSADGLGWG